MIALFSVACGSQDEGSLPKNTELNIDLQFPGAMALHQIEKLKSDIEYYKFEFSGKFSSPIVREIEQKKYQEYRFSEIPFDSNLHILVQALGLDGQTIHCTGEVTTPFIDGTDRTVTIELRCP